MPHGSDKARWHSVERLGYRLCAPGSAGARLAATREAAPSPHYDFISADKGILRP